jgi:hypothetical protein
MYHDQMSPFIFRFKAEKITMTPRSTLAFASSVFVVLSAVCANASAAARVLTLNLVAKSLDGSPLSRACIVVDVEAGAYGVRTDTNGEATVEVPIADGEVEVRAQFFSGVGEVNWITPVNGGSASTKCGISRFSLRFAERTWYRTHVPASASSVKVELKPIPVVSVSGRIVDSFGHPLAHNGCTILGTVTASIGNEDGTFRISGVPVGEATTLAICVDGQYHFAPLPPSQDDLQLGDLCVDIAPRNAPLKITCPSSSTLPPVGLGGSFTLVSLDGSLVYGATLTEQGWLPGPAQGDSLLFAPGSYFAFPSDIQDPRVESIVSRIRAGSLQATESLPRVTVIANKPTALVLQVQECELAIRSALRVRPDAE